MYRGRDELGSRTTVGGRITYADALKILSAEDSELTLAVDGWLGRVLSGAAVRGDRLAA
jgi:hypothetical protein